MSSDNIILGILVVVLILGILYIGVSAQPTHDNQGRQLYSADLTYRANNPLFGPGYLTELEVSNFQIQQVIGLFIPYLFTFPWDNNYNQKIYVVCDEVQVFYTGDKVTALEGVFGLGEVTIKNLPSGTHSILTMEMFKVEDNMKKGTETTTFIVP